MALVLLATACGDSGNGDGVASLDDTATTVSTERGDVEGSLLEFATCVREQGVELPDPVVNADGSLEFVGGLDEDLDPDALLDARDACSEFLSGLTIEQFGIDRTEIEDRLVTYAACMRENGYDLPDPDLDAFLARILGEGRQNPEGAAGFSPFGDAVDPEDPDFLSADEVCRPIAFTGFEGQTEGGPFDQGS